MSGSNRGKLGKGAAKIVGTGRFSGRSMGIKKGPGVPGAKHKRKSWGEGPPLKQIGDNKFESTRY